MYVACKISFLNDHIRPAFLISKSKISLSMEVAQVELAFGNLRHNSFPIVKQPFVP